MAGDIPQCMHCGVYMHVNDLGQPHQCGITPFWYRDNVMNKSASYTPHDTPPPATGIGRDALRAILAKWYFSEHGNGSWEWTREPENERLIDAILAAMPTGEVAHTDSAQDSMKSVDGDLVTKARAACDAYKLLTSHKDGCGCVRCQNIDALREALGEVKPPPQDLGIPKIDSTLTMMGDEDG